MIKVGEAQLDVKQLKLETSLGENDFQLDASDHFETIKRRVKGTNQRLFEKCKATTKKFEANNKTFLVFTHLSAPEASKLINDPQPTLSFANTRAEKT